MIFSLPANAQHFFHALFNLIVYKLYHGIFQSGPNSKNILKILSYQINNINNTHCHKIGFRFQMTLLYIIQHVSKKLEMLMESEPSTLNLSKITNSLIIVWSPTSVLTKVQDSLEFYHNTPSFNCIDTYLNMKNGLELMNKI